MSEQGWPTPERHAQAPLPRVEDLPAAEQGYDRDSVRAAFDAFYRHAAQLDATLRALEAVEIFQRQAEELRSDLRAVRSATWNQPPEPWTRPSYSYGGETVERVGIPPAVWRIAVEIVFLIAVAVAVGVANVQPVVIVAVMAAAFLIVCAAEWVAGRERAWIGRVPPQPVVEPAPPVPPVAAAPELPADTEEAGWTAFEEAQEPSDAMTIVGLPPEEEEAQSEPDAEPEQAPELEPMPEPEVAPAPEAEVEAASARESEPEPEPAADEAAPPVAAEGEPDAAPAPEPEPAPEPQRRRWFRRRAEAAPAPEPPPEPPRHVRVLPHESPDERQDSWERGFEDVASNEDEPSARDSVAGDASYATEPPADAGDASASDPEPEEAAATTDGAEPAAASPELEPVAAPRRRRRRRR